MGSIATTKLAVLKTVTWNADLSTICSSGGGDFEREIRPLVNVARQTGRAIRVRAPSPWRIFSADSLGSLGVRLVPAQFWGSVSPDVATVTSVADAVSANANEVQMDIATESGAAGDNAIVDSGRRVDSGFTCRLLQLPLSSRPGCLRHCDGKHF